MAMLRILWSGGSQCLKATAKDGYVKDSVDLHRNEDWLELI